jgi:hypothetical protein
MSMIQRVSSVILVAVAWLVLASCNRDDAGIDRSFITDDPCAAPCWYGLKLESSTLEEYRQKLTELPFVEQGSVGQAGANYDWIGETEAVEVWYRCSGLPGRFCGSALFTHDRLRSLRLAVRYDLALVDLVEKLGSPETVSCFDNIGGGSDVSFYWPERNIIAASVDRGRCSGAESELPSDMSISWLEYASDARFEACGLDCEGFFAWPGLAD